MERDFFEVLGISRDASSDEISKAYRNLAKKYHPDVNKEEGAVEKFKEAARAYEVLRDDEKRANYLAFGTADRRRQHSSFDDQFFNQFFNQAFRQARRTPENAPVQTKVEVTLEEVANGCKKSVTFSYRNLCKYCKGSGAEKLKKCNSCGGSGFKSQRQGAWTVQAGCSTCSGTGNITEKDCDHCSGDGRSDPIERQVEIDIPAGVMHGMHLSLQPEDMVAELFVTVNVKKHSLFSRVENHLYLEMPVSYTQLALGCKVDIPTLDGTVEVQIPAGTQSNNKLRLGGKGLKDLRTGFLGDLYVVLILEVPKKLNKRYRKILEELKELEEKNVTPAQKAYNKKMKEND